VVEVEVLAGWAFFPTSFAAYKVPEKVHHKNPAINRLSQRHFMRYPPEIGSRYSFRDDYTEIQEKIHEKNPFPARDGRVAFSWTSEQFLFEIIVDLIDIFRLSLMALAVR
jgi:hypothetical protein